MKYLLIALLLACNSSPSGDKGPQIQHLIVKTGSHSKIDLEKETYTVYFMNGTSYDCRFTLSDRERIDIQQMAQACELNKLRDSIDVEDKCSMFPKVFTQLSFYVEGNHVQVSLDAHCDEYPLFKGREPKKIVRFLKFLHEKILVKPEVARAPQTDIHYM